MKIACIAINELGIIAVGEATENPNIFIIDQGKLETTHKQGINHMSFYKDKLYSLGNHNNVYSINIHNYKQRKLLSERVIQERIDSFLVTNENEFYSFEEVKIWTDLCPS